MAEKIGDPIYPDALAFITDVQMVSVSKIQRKFRLGYNRACRIVERMEKEGVVTEPEHNGARRVLILP